MEEELTTRDGLVGLEDSLEDFWATLNDDSSLDDDTKASITVIMERAEDAVTEAKKVIADLPEDD